MAPCRGGVGVAPPAKDGALPVTLGSQQPGARRQARSLSRPIAVHEQALRSTTRKRRRLHRTDAAGYEGWTSRCLDCATPGGPWRAQERTGRPCLASRSGNQWQSGLRRSPGPDNRCECLHLSLLWLRVRSRWRHAVSDLLAVAYRDERAGFDRAEAPWRHAAVTWPGDGQSLARLLRNSRHSDSCTTSACSSAIVVGSPNIFVGQGSCATRWGSVLCSGTARARPAGTISSPYLGTVTILLPRSVSQRNRRL